MGEEENQGHLVLPRGTRVLVVADVPLADGGVCGAGSPARVERVEHPRYVVQTPAGALVETTRENLRILKKSVDAALQRRALDYGALADRVILAVVVGSTAWGLSEGGSDVDLRGAFLLPFDLAVGIERGPEEIRAPHTDAQYLEVERFIRLALDADPNVIEALWAEDVRVLSEEGAWLREAREAFLSRRVYRSFGRYAMSQLDRMGAQLDWLRDEAVMVEAMLARPELGEAALRDHLVERGAFASRREAGQALTRLGRSLFDRDVIPNVGFEAVRAWAPSWQAPDDPDGFAGAKNAYNLIRLLRSGVEVLERGAPLIRIEPDRPDGLREHLLAIKRRQRPLRAVLDEARELAAALEDAWRRSPLPEEPDLATAHALLVRCRAASLSARLGTGI